MAIRRGRVTALLHRVCAMVAASVCSAIRVAERWREIGTLYAEGNQFLYLRRMEPTYLIVLKGTIDFLFVKSWNSFSVCAERNQLICLFRRESSVVCLCRREWTALFLLKGINWYVSVEGNQLICLCRKDPSHLFVLEGNQLLCVWRGPGTRFLGFGGGFCEGKKLGFLQLSLALFLIPPLSCEDIVTTFLISCIAWKAFVKVVVFMTKCL